MLLEKPSPLSNMETMIDLHDPGSMKHWTKVFGITELDLTIAVHNVGPQPKDLVQLLRMSRR